MDAGRVQGVWILVLALALFGALEMLDLRGPDPEVPRYVVDAPSEHEFGPKGCGLFCRDGRAPPRSRSRVAK